MDWNLAVALISAIAGVAAAWFGYVAVRGQIRRRKPDVTLPQPSTGDKFDVFVSYAPADEDKAEQLAIALKKRGVRVFLARWIGPGLVEYAEKERALSVSANGILLFSRSTMADPAIRDEYALLLDRIHSGGRRFIPAKVDDVELPAYAKIRKPLDLTDPRKSDANLSALVRAIRA